MWYSREAISVHQLLLFDGRPNKAFCNNRRPRPFLRPPRDGSCMRIYISFVYPFTPYQSAIALQDFLPLRAPTGRCSLRRWRSPASAQHALHSRGLARTVRRHSTEPRSSTPRSRL